MKDFLIDGVDYINVDSNLKKVRRIILSLVTVPLIIADVVVAYYVNLHLLWINMALLLAFVWLWWLVGKQVDNYKYAKAEKDLIIAKGVMFKEYKIIPYGRMQYVDVNQGPLLRYFGLATVILNTASSHSHMPIHGIKNDDAHSLRKELIELGEANLAGL